MVNLSLSLILLASLLLQAGGGGPVKGPLGIFETAVDVGKDLLPGSSLYDSEKDEYRLVGGGANMWGTTDAFHFLHSRMSADQLHLTCRVGLLESDGDPHRKAGWMIRESLDPDSPYVDAVVHADGLVSLQYRETQGGETKEVKASPAAARSDRLALERKGDLFSLWVEGEDGKLIKTGETRVKLPSNALVGLVVCAHNAKRSETAVFAQVQATKGAR